jgi:hypothetical protein
MDTCMDFPVDFDQSAILRLRAVGYKEGSTRAIGEGRKVMAKRGLFMV